MTRAVECPKPSRTLRGALTRLMEQAAAQADRRAQAQETRQ